MPAAVWTEEKAQGITIAKIESYKAAMDDPRPLLKDLSLKKILPPEIYAKMTYDVETMKRLWAEAVGFKAPDVVENIAPEIKPGTYTYKDKEKYPFKELMYPELYNRFKPGGRPHIGNFPEIKVVPTRQYYWAQPIAEATKKQMGKTKLDDQGYIIADTYVAGYPFPRPSGKFKAQQIMYNWENRYYGGENGYIFQHPFGYTGKFVRDLEAIGEMAIFKMNGRVLIEPYGWYDKRAEKLGERRAVNMLFLSPRDMYGNVLNIISYVDPDKYDQTLVYVNVLRRVRKLSATDTQDVVAGGDLIYDDNESFNHKLSPNRYPYKYDLIAEREYLVPAPQWDGSYYLTSDSLEFHNFEFERRPTYVIKLTQLDKNYVYGHRILYIDKETFLLYHIENYNQKGSLYRSAENIPAFYPDLGLFCSNGIIGRDYIDLHSFWGRHYTIPTAYWLGRKDLGLRKMIFKGK